MTEKRFTLTHINEQHFSANIYDDKTFIASIGIGAELIIELLNSLNDENMKLRARNKYLAMKIERERNSTQKQYAKWEKEAETKIKELSEENEQLKQDKTNLHRAMSRNRVRYLNENEELKQFKTKTFEILNHNIQEASEWKKLDMSNPEKTRLQFLESILIGIERELKNND